MRRKTAGEYLAQLRDIARARGGALLSSTYLGDATKLRWRCAEGHHFLQRPTGVKQDKWCRLCGWMRAAVTRKAHIADRLRRVVTRRSGIILSRKYVDASTPVRFRCGQGHEWAAAPRVVADGSWCRRCSNQSRFAAQRDRVLRRLRRVARRRGGEVVRPVHDRGRSPFVFRCARGHVWRSLPAGVDRGAWCKVCAREAYRERLRKLARDQGGELLSRTYLGEERRLHFRCAQGHRFEQRPGDTVGGSWCPRCSIARRAEKRKAPARARLYRVVAERGGSVLSPAYVNSQTKLRYRCAKGHEWETVPNSILVGSWCPVCANAERALRPRRPGAPGRIWRRTRQGIEGIVRERGGVIVPPGYANFRTRLSIRCGRGHDWTARPDSLREGARCPSCKAESLLSTLRQVAKRWGGECLAAACRSGREVLPWRCALGHRFRKAGNVAKRGSWCPVCRQLRRGSIQQMRAIARERGGECLSERYVDAETDLRWRCREGHEWSVGPGEIVQGHWCPVCRYRLSYSRARLRIEDMRLTAAERGGECLSAAYHGNKVRLRWRCARGHKWLAHPNRVRHGSWCPACAHTPHGTLETMRALANERGGRCLARTWNNHKQRLHFECTRGHRFHALAATVKTGVWCPRCAPPWGVPARLVERSAARSASRG